MSNGTPTLSWQPQPQPVVSPLPRLGRRFWPWIDPGLKVLIPAVLIGFLVLAVKFGSFQAYAQLLSRHAFTSFLPALGAGYAVLMLLFQLGRTILWARYQPYPPAAGPLPRLTVIIPAYNEGAMVEKAIDAVADSDYPPTGWKSSASTTAPRMTPGFILSKPSGVIPTSSSPSGLPPTGAKRRGSTPGSPGAGARSSSPSIPTVSSPRRPCATWWPPCCTTA